MNEFTPYQKTDSRKLRKTISNPDEIVEILQIILEIKKSLKLLEIPIKSGVKLLAKYSRWRKKQN